MRGLEMTIGNGFAMELGRFCCFITIGKLTVQSVRSSGKWSRKIADEISTCWIGYKFGREWMLEWVK